MLKHLWSVIAQQSIIDQETNNITIVNVLEEIQMQRNKAMPIQNDVAFAPVKHEIISYWLCDEDAPADLEIKLTVTDGENKELATSKSMFPINKIGKKFRSIQKLETIPVKGSGEYWYGLSYRTGAGAYKDVASIPVNIAIE